MRWLSLVLGCVWDCVAVGTDLHTLARIDRVVRAYMQREHIPGVAVVALQDDRVILAQSWGFADVASRAAMTPDAVQPIYSISKHMTAAAVLSLAEQGRLDVRDHLGRHLPEGFSDEPQLQLLHLLRHTSGVPEFIGLDGIEAIESGARPNASVADVLDIVDRAPRRFAWVAYLPDHKLTVAVLGNRGWLWSTDLGVPIGRALLGQRDPPPLRREAVSEEERRVLSTLCEDGLFDFEIDARRRDVRVTVAPFGAPIELWRQAPGLFVSALRPDTFRLMLPADGSPPQFDWMEHWS